MEIRAYRWKKRLAILFPLAMLVIGYLALPLPGNEIFPFYSWSMFSLVPSQKNAYVIFIVRKGATRIDPPVEFQKAGNLVAEQSSIVAYRDIQKLGQAFEGHSTDFNDLRKLFEQNYIYPGTCYRLERINYDPLTRWKTGGNTMEVLQEWTRTE